MTVQLLNDALKGVNSSGTSSHITVLAAPLAVPSTQTLPRDVPNFLKVFNSLPPAGDVLWDTKIATINVVQAMKSSSDLIEIGKPKLSDDKKLSLKAARSLLFDILGGDSDRYSRYKHYKKRSEDLEKNRKDALTLAAKFNVDQEIQRNADDWRNLGFRDEVDQALSTIEDLDEQQTRQLAADWRQTLELNESETYLPFWNTIRDDGAWTYRGVTKEDATLSIVKTASGTKNVERLSAGTIAMSFRLCRAVLNRSAFYHPFLQNRYWRFKDRTLIADSAPLVDGPAERAPRVVVELFVVGDIRFVINGASEWKSLEKTLSTSDHVTIDGFTAKDVGQAPYTLPHMVTIPGLYIVAVTTLDVQPSPNPIADSAAEW